MRLGREIGVKDARKLLSVNKSVIIRMFELRFLDFTELLNRAEKSE